jgi:hypothetical protein
MLLQQIPSMTFRSAGALVRMGLRVYKHSAPTELAFGCDWAKTPARVSGWICFCYGFSGGSGLSGGKSFSSISSITFSSAPNF